MGRITEKIKRIKDKKFIEGWYNCQMFQGRAFLRFQWIPLSPHMPEELKAKPDAAVGGVLCLLIGTLYCQEVIRPTCCLELREGDEIAKGTSLDAVSNDIEWTFNEGKVFRVRNFNQKDILLTMKVYDNKNWRWIGERVFRMKRLLEYPLKGYFKLPNPVPNMKPVGLSMYSRVLYDAEV